MNNRTLLYLETLSPGLKFLSMSVMLLMGTLEEMSSPLPPMTPGGIPPTEFQ